MLTSIAKGIAKVTRSFVRHNNSLTVSPPGRLPRGEINKNIIVASMKRSGTHVLIDLLLNNFAEFRNTPLYVDLDQYLWSGGSIEALASTRGVIFKTHFPQVIPPNFDEAIKQIRANSLVISPYRKFEDVARSLTNFEPSDRVFSKDVELSFWEYWKNFEPAIFHFSDMLKRESCNVILREISAAIQVPERKKVKYPPSGGTPVFLVYLWKFTTRILGRYSPIINTTISFKVN